VPVILGPPCRVGVAVLWIADGVELDQHGAFAARPNLVLWRRAVRVDASLGKLFTSQV
jgi:hypothetical protein